MDVVGAPEVVGHHREVLEDRILAVAREDARRHVVEAEHEVGDAVLLLQRMGLVELLELVGRELDHVAEAERLEVVEIDVRRSRPCCRCESDRKVNVRCLPV